MPAFRARGSRETAPAIPAGHMPPTTLAVPARRAGMGSRGSPSAPARSTARSWPERSTAAGSGSRCTSRSRVGARDASASRVIRVLLAEDQTMVRTALASLLNLEPDIEVVAQVSRGDEVVAAADASVPDVALLDIEMPGSTGLDAADDLRRALPDCRIVILTTFGRPGYLRRDGERRGRLPP